MSKSTFINSAAIVVMVFLWGLLFGCLSLAAGCHTVHGFGSDLKDWSSQYVERPTE